MGLLGLFERSKPKSAPLGADGVYGWFKEQIDAFDYPDRVCFTGLETQITMLWRLSSYFPNVVITRKIALVWRETALEHFDRQSAELGDAEEVADWRHSIECSFDRLIGVLSPGA